MATKSDKVKKRTPTVEETAPKKSAADAGVIYLRARDADSPLPSG